MTRTTNGARALATLLVLAAGLLSCGDDPSVVVLTEADTGAEVLVASGDQLEVRLEANPGTGFTWAPDVGAVDSFVEIVQTRYEPPSQDDQLGGTGIEVFDVDLSGAGAGVLRFEYIRPVDDAPVPERIVEFILRVDDRPWPPASRGSAPATSTAAAPPSGSVEIPVLLADGEPGPVVVSGFVIWDATAAQHCELLLESAPPQCGGASIAISDPERLQPTLGIGLDELSGVRWTPNRVDVAAHFDGRMLTIGR